MTAATPTPETIVNLRLAEVHPAADNVRADVGDVTELAASIAEVGVLEPLIVVPASGNGGGYTIVVGHRRLAAAKVAGIPTVPVIIRQLLKPSKVRREALEFALRQLIQTALDSKPELGRIAGELLEVKAKDRAGDPRFKALANSSAGIDKLAYALAIAAGEAPFAQLAARSYFPEEYSSHAARYFAHLKAANYKATPIELAQIKPSGWRPAFDA